MKAFYESFDSVMWFSCYASTPASLRSEVGTPGILRRARARCLLTGDSAAWRSFTFPGIWVTLQYAKVFNSPHSSTLSWNWEMRLSTLLTKKEPN